MTSGDAMGAVQGGLRREWHADGRWARPGSMQVSPLIPARMGNRSVKGWYSGTSIDSQDTLGSANGRPCAR